MALAPMLPEAIASMGPRLLSRGVERASAHLRADSDRFNGAAASQPRSRKQFKTTNRAHDRLQWGRGFSAAESCRRVPRHSMFPAASMGPRLLSRGVLALVLFGLHLYHASMGPRLLSRGVKAMTLTARRIDQASMGPRLLSRGVETSTRARAPNWIASMGPRLLSRGVRLAQLPLGDLLLASMGPRLLSRGVGTGCRATPCCWRRFNGAAASQPRSPAKPRLDVPDFLLLQWGRGFSAAESRKHGRQDDDDQHASMGPRLLSRGVNRDDCLVSGAILRASMGPRLLSRGVSHDRRQR